MKILFFIKKLENRLIISVFAIKQGVFLGFT